MLAVTVSQVVALLSSALSGSAVAAAGRTKAAGLEGDRSWRRCGGEHDHSAPAPGYCCVCISACRDGEDDIRRLPCGHTFHRDCVDRWLARCRRTCPLCRLHVDGGAAVGLELLLDQQQQQQSEDLVIWFCSLYLAGL